MEEKRQGHESTASRVEADRDGQVTINWDNADFRTIRSDSFRVSATQEEISLLFAPDKPLHPDEQKVINIPFSTKIVLSPFLAKQLAILLSQVVRECESKSTSAAPLSAPPPDKLKINEKADQLLHLLSGLNVCRPFESSFKVGHGMILANRFLTWMRKDAIQGNPEDHILNICARMSMPDNLLPTFRNRLADADVIHIGFEENETTCLYKVYLEFFEQINKAAKAQPGQAGPFLLYLGFKWDPSNNTKTAITRYNWYPLLSIDAIQERYSSLIDPRRYAKLLEITNGIVNLASARIPSQDILFLEVTEESNPRISFDINLYRASIRLEELYLFLMEVCRHYSISYKAFRGLYEQAKNQRFGHMSFGIDREGRDFFTVYYGAEAADRPKDSLFISGHEPPGAEGPEWGRPVQKRAYSGVEARDKKAALLFRLIKQLDTRVGIERSFKFLQKTLLPDRFLIGFQPKRINREPRESILDICRKIEMPEDFLEKFQESLPESNIVLFGFERNENHRIYKAYLEFAHRIGEAIKQNPDNPGPVVIHNGFKWDVSDNSRKTTAIYTCFPLLSVQQMLERMSKFSCDELKGAGSFAESALRVAAAQRDPKSFLYCETSEQNNVRSSFDINFYTADVRLSELYPLLLQICWHYGIPYREFNKVYEPAKDQRFGHLTGGMDREGREFFTIYFAEKDSLHAS